MRYRHDNCRPGAVYGCILAISQPAGKGNEWHGEAVRPTGRQETAFRGELALASAHDGGQTVSKRSRRRSRQPVRRVRSLRFGLTDVEYGEVRAAAA